MCGRPDIAVEGAWSLVRFQRLADHRRTDMTGVDPKASVVPMRTILWQVIFSHVQKSARPPHTSRHRRTESDPISTG